MGILSKLRSKKAWNSLELKEKCERYDKISIITMILIILSAWLSPQYIPSYAKGVTLGLIGIAVLCIILAWNTEKQDNKLTPPPTDDRQDNVGQDS